MSRIDVAKDGKRFKIMINFVKRHDYSDAKLANKEAKKIHDKEFPTYSLNLIKAGV